MKKINENLNTIWELLESNGVDALVVMSNDAHNSEYVANHWQVRQQLSGFLGSAGTLVITRSGAGLWTDSRYFIEAEEVLKGTLIELHKIGQPNVMGIWEWLASILHEGAKIAVDGEQMMISTMDFAKKKLLSSNITLHTSKPWIDMVWEDRPTLPRAKVFGHEIKYAVTSRAQKISSLRDKMSTEFLLVTGLDEVAWLLNLRGNDVESNPVFYAYVLLSTSAITLYIDLLKLEPRLKNKLTEEGILLRPYAELYNDLENIGGHAEIGLQKSMTSARLLQALENNQVYWLDSSPVSELKSIKSRGEVSHIKNAMVKDGIALTKAIMWLEKELVKNEVSEFDFARKLASFRSQQIGYYGESFKAIVGFEGNGAIVHYRPEKTKSKTIKQNGVLLVDSGGQYTDGTTDITRMFFFGTPNEEIKKAYTLVLKGHISLAKAIFLKGTTGVQLDMLARMPLWNQKLNYGHGTGHGVGYFLNVHEGPQGIAPQVNNPRATIEFQEGMLTSNEPGFYKQGAFGMRIENLLLCVSKGKNEFGEWLGFEDLTLFPINLSMAAIESLSKDEITWINKYHNMVFEELSPHLDKLESNWLKQQTKGI